MIEKILNRLGYYKQDSVRNLESNPFTQEEILSLYVDTVDSLDNVFDEIEEKKIMSQLKHVDGFMQWINFVVENDIKNHFSAINDNQRQYIRGMMQRLLDIKKRLVNSDKVIKTKISGIRYG